MGIKANNRKNLPIVNKTIVINKPITYQDTFTFTGLNIAANDD